MRDRVGLHRKCGHSIKHILCNVALRNEVCFWLVYSSLNNILFDRDTPSNDTTYGIVQDFLHIICNIPDEFKIPQLLQDPSFAIVLSLK
jgi:hypothetical protein